MCSADQMHKSKEKLIAFGNPNVILCERGNSFGYQDLVVDPRNLVWLKSDTNLVSMDITHCLQQPSQKMADGTVKSGGFRELIPYMGKMAVSLPTPSPTSQLMSITNCFIPYPRPLEYFSPLETMKKAQWHCQKYFEPRYSCDFPLRISCSPPTKAITPLQEAICHWPLGQIE